jgi:Arc/MetJ-type ribon-helix-helix transcriptional regulator
MKSSAASDARLANPAGQTVIKLELNRQQLELIDRVVAQGLAADRASLVRLALREYAAAQGDDGAAAPKR